MRKLTAYRISIVSILISLITNPAVAQQTTATKGGMQYFIYGAAAFALISLVITIYFLRLKNKFQKEAIIRTGKVHQPTGLRKFWSNLDKRFFTKAAPLEKEADVLLDHDYDGIKELDNALPPWWKWGFYFTIIVAVIYLLRFHVFKTGPTPEEEYNKEMQIASAKLDLYRSKHKAQFDESTVTLADAAGIAEGKKIFTSTCFPCHGTNGEGNAVGPNLTDKYWLHGGSINNVFKTITYGVPDKGMQAWGKTFSPTEVRDLASYVLSLQGSNPPNAKPPQGDLYEPGKVTDSSAVKKDSTSAKPVQ
jgi:cytochrome c oxidase cbb3-type subunit 3